MKISLLTILTACAHGADTAAPFPVAETTSVRNAGDGSLTGTGALHIDFTQTQRPYSIVLGGGVDGQPLITLSCKTGDITFAKGIDPSDAALVFWWRVEQAAGPVRSLTEALSRSEGEVARLTRELEEARRHRVEEP